MKLKKSREKVEVKRYQHIGEPSVAISVRVSKDDHALLLSESRKRGLSVSGIIAEAIRSRTLTSGKTVVY